MGGIIVTSTTVSVSSRLTAIRQGLSRGEWVRVAGMAATVIGLFALGLTMMLIASRSHYHLSKTQLFGAGTGLLALTLGMRHAFDADHISAIDNTTRKLMAEGKRPMSVGFFFSLGHSTIVFIMALLLNFGIRALDDQVKNDSSALHNITGIIGTSVSGTFLYLIAGLNIVILASIIRATEVALLVLSGSAVSSGLPFYAIMSLPILFAAGMSLFDTIDGCFMNFAYGWAFSRPIRKVYYNITITGLSVAVAFLIGTIEILGLFSSEFDLTGGFWDFMANFDINKAGFAIVGLFVVTWIVALSIWKFGHVEARWEAAAARSTASRTTTDDHSRTA
jgi:high-affinity nickel-transport protein